MARSKDIGTMAETAVVKVLREHGWHGAERRALRGALDCGDIAGVPGVVFEVKGGEAAKTASDGQVAVWLEETERERKNAIADVGVLVLQRKGIGYPNAGQWWAVVPLSEVSSVAWSTVQGNPPVRMLLRDFLDVLADRGF